MNWRASTAVGLSFLVLVSLLLASAASAATSTYLGPNADLEMNRWSVVGTESAWEALDDALTEVETPTNADYVTVSQSNGRLELGLSTTSLKEQTLLKADAWFYTGTTAALTYSIRTVSPTTGNTVTLAKGQVSSAGWHQVSLPRSLNQAELDAATMRFVTESGTTTRQVSVAFVKLLLEPVPSSIYWGSWMDGDVYTENPEEQSDAPWNPATWSSFEEGAGKTVSVVHFGQPAPWNQKFDPVPLTKTRERKAIPLMDMDPDGVPLISILDKAKPYEAAFKQWAEAVASYGQPFFFRWAWEMNGGWFQHGEEALASPSTYIAVWKRLHDIADTAGATNITWVWCPNVSNAGPSALEALYPGNAYVDWTCIDGYNEGGAGWISFSDLFRPTYNDLLDFEARTKPIMIGETGAVEAGGSKSAWITAALNSLKTEFSQVRAFLWFNWNIIENGEQRNWQIESSTASQEAFASGISAGYFSPGSFPSSTPLTKIQPLP
jgi:hypothetical protein